VPQQLAIRNSIQTLCKMQLAFCNTNCNHFVVAAACAFKSWLIGLFWAQHYALQTIGRIVSQVELSFPCRKWCYIEM